MVKLKVKSNSAHQQSHLPRSLWLNLLCKATRGQSPGTSKTPSESGLTLIECLVAMIIITVVVAIITPPIFLAVGTRVNNRRTEQALQVAQEEIERVRLLVISEKAGTDIENQLPPVANGVTRTSLGDAAVPNSVCDPATKAGPPPLCSDAQSLFLAFGSGVNDPSALYVQTFRDEGKTKERTLANGTKVNEIIAFNMGVRVYSHEALNAAKTGVGTLDASGQAGSINFTSGTKTRGSRPLVVLYTEMTRGTEADALSGMKEYTSEP
ncbi:MAG: prepilin-type N-terminal cleavage/methylation domain-containing protein [Synechococcales cyanobacterium RU_4_20]|nr:prepilin-type N-terminal cleavage/methylation domain-containing protein [Synechococcales cyanobacterium RU_4_20]NJR69251.1 prepilin-type N-terminal cleavage/methylation domain-containing protein [Synechococcales cyanobacterium CRU_2_2]